MKHSCCEYVYIYFRLTRRNKELMQNKKMYISMLRTTSLLREGNTATAQSLFGGWTILS
jgi:hypothetical protein